MHILLSQQNLDLNTSHVNVNRKTDVTKQRELEHLNTSHVNVNQKVMLIA